MFKFQQSAPRNFKIDIASFWEATHFNFIFRNRKIKFVPGNAMKHMVVLWADPTKQESLSLRDNRNWDPFDADKRIAGNVVRK
jgi:hypothetical protein